jgi:hypothetical protein
MIETQSITIEVDARIARAYRKASQARRRKLNVLLSLRLNEVMRSRRPLEAIIHEVSQRAQERGLTQEKLDQLLQEG